MELIDFGKLFHGLHFIGDVQIFVSLLGRRSYPWTEKGLTRWNSFLRVIFEHFQDQIVGLWTDFTPIFFGKINISSQYFFINHFIIFAVKRRGSWEHDVKNDSQGPYVAFFVVFFLDNFGRNIVNLSKTIFTLPILRVYVLSSR